jgi:hypothetical protein
MSETQKLRRAAAECKRPASPAASFDNLKILRIDYCDNDSCFLEELPKFVTHLQELEIRENRIRPTAILASFPILTTLFVRSYFMQLDLGIGPG